MEDVSQCYQLYSYIQVKRWQGYKTDFRKAKCKVYKNGKYENTVECFDFTTDNRRELKAITEVVTNAPFGLYTKFVLYTDNEYVRHVLDHNDKARFYKANGDLISDFYAFTGMSSMNYEVKSMKEAGEKLPDFIYTIDYENYDVIINKGE